MKIVRRIGVVVATATLGLGLTAALAVPANAMDTSWGCGGYCAVKK
ncbi:hypothetical protein [Nocardioides sp. GY 10127]|nr:hypothetical protein [Nocardioides sp. GY 10127]